jgi:guanylate kinase
VGKDTILSILRRWGLPLYFASTSTTRPRRRGDPTRGGFLRFITPAEHDRLLAEGGLLEHADVYGHRYGVPKAPISEALARGQDVILRVDVQGMTTIKRLLPGAVTIFLEPPSLEALAVRLRHRGADDEATVRRRLDVARREIETVGRFDYRLVNDEGSARETAARVAAIIATEKSRVGRQPIVID